LFQLAPVTIQCISASCVEFMVLIRCMCFCSLSQKGHSVFRTANQY